MTSQIIGSDFTAAPQLANYVNGRVLTAEDLATSQATLQARDGRLGRAAGHGVLDGLWVTATATTLTVAKGLGVTASGEPVGVGASVTLPLTFVPSPGGSPAGAMFSCCTPAQATGTAAVAIGCYLLTALPACQLAGQAPLAAPPGSTMPAGCVAQWCVEGVQFKAIKLPLGDSVLGVPVNDSNRRNLLAHWCFGTAKLTTLGADPFGFNPAYGGFDTLDAADLSSGDLPLAVFYWTGQTVGFVDNWSARRRITAPDAVNASWSAVVSDRRFADAQARFLQFQDQAAELVASGAAGKVAAASTFPVVPPVAFLPIGVQHVAPVVDQMQQVAAKVQFDAAPGAQIEQPTLFATSHQGVLHSLTMVPQEHIAAVAAAMADRPPQPGFDPGVFFGTAATCGGVLDWEFVDFALRQSWHGDPATMTSVSATDQPAPATLLYYLVRQNLLAGSLGGGGIAPNLYVVFIRKYQWVAGTQLPFVLAQSVSPGG